MKNLHQKILNAKYQKAVLKVKLANLKIVAQKQKDFVKQLEQFKTVKDEQELLLDNQLQRFHSRKNFICQTKFRKTRWFQTKIGPTPLGFIQKDEN